MKPQHAPALVHERGPRTAPAADQGPRFPKLQRALKQPEIQAQVGWQALPLEVPTPDRRWRLWLAGVLALGLATAAGLTPGVVKRPVNPLALPDLSRSSAAGGVVQPLPMLERPALVARAGAKVALQSSLKAVVEEAERAVP